MTSTRAAKRTPLRLSPAPSADREAALRSVRRARRHLEPVRSPSERRRERFAYLKRVYD